MPAEAILDVAPLEVQGKRTLRGFVGKLFRKRWSRQDPSATLLLTPENYEADVPIVINNDKEESAHSVASGSNGPSDAPLSRDSSFTISALRTGKSLQSNDDVQYVALMRGGRQPDTRKLGKASYHLIASTVPNKTRQADIVAIDRELQRMFKLQLGPLTLVSDIPPILRLWSRLQAARGSHGRKAVASTWLDLSRATAVVAKKMELPQITTVLEAQCKLVYPCPRGLRLPADMLTALADSANTGGALSRASDIELLQFCDCIGRLMDDATTVKGSSTAVVISTEHWLRALSRAANMMPLVEAGLKEVARRAKDLAEEIDAQSCEDPHGATVLQVISLTDALSELAGTRVAALSRCLDAATMSAAAAVQHVQAAAKAKPWWKKMIPRPGKLKKQIQGITFCLDRLLPSHTALGAHEAARNAAEAADTLARVLVPSILPALNAENLGHLAVSLMVATEEDVGSPAHEPFRQALGLVAAEAVERTERTRREDPNVLTQTCARAVVMACRKRLLHIKFTLLEPAEGLPVSLSKLESWRGRMKRGPLKTHQVEVTESEAEEEQFEDAEELSELGEDETQLEQLELTQEQALAEEQETQEDMERSESDDKEAVSLELHESLIVLEDGEEVSSAQIDMMPTTEVLEPSAAVQQEEEKEEKKESMPQQGSLINYLEF